MKKLKTFENWFLSKPKVESSKIKRKLNEKELEEIRFKEEVKNYNL